MNLSCRNFSRIAIIAIAVIMTAHAANAAATTKNSTSPSSSEIAAASRTENRLFIGGLIWLIASTLITAWLGLMAWRASNKRQELEALNANVRIEEARGTAAQANADAARANAGLAQSNEEIAKLNKGTEELRARNLETESRLESERRRRVELEKSLAPPSFLITPRVREKLARHGRVHVSIEFQEGDREAENTAFNLWGVLVSAGGWQVSGSSPVRMLPNGISILFDLDRAKNRDDPVKAAAEDLAGYLTANDFEAKAVPWPDLQNKDGLVVQVGIRFNRYLSDVRIPEGMRQSLKPALDRSNSLYKEEHDRAKREWFPENQNPPK